MDGSHNVAIVGRPNVGKSALFNRLVEKRISIVDETSGVTRDRIVAECSWLNFRFNLIDTGGLEFKNSESSINFLNKVKEQTKASIYQSSMVIFVVDLKCGVTLVDFEIAKMLRKLNKFVVVCVNKSDNVGAEPSEFYDFYKLGFKNIFAVSAIHGYGVGDLLNCVVANLPKTVVSSSSENEIKIAIVGRPNVGKSSVLNKVLGNERVIVAKQAGTTRDAIDVKISKNGMGFVFIDTAGIFKKSNKVSSVERYSLVRTYAAIDRADICLVVLDGFEGVTEQDIKIAGYVHNKGKGSLILINKFDLVENKAEYVSKFDENLKIDLNFMSYFINLYVSAKTGQRLHKLFNYVKIIQSEREKRLSTGVLNSLLSFCISRVPPPAVHGNRLKIYYMTQVAVNPPTFVFFVNNVDFFHFSYKRYLENQIRLAFGFKGTPIKLVVKVCRENRFKFGV